MSLDTTHTLWMGCKKVIHTTDELESYERTGLYIAEPKYDGIFGAIQAQGKLPPKVFSRTAKQKDILFPPIQKSGTIIVGELAFGTQEGTGLAQKLGHAFINAFDILQFHGRDVTTKSFFIRRSYLIEFMLNLWATNNELKEWYQLAPQWRHHFIRHFNAEHEGLVLKLKASGPYISGPNSRTKEWVKAKKMMTVDMIIMDYTPSSAVTFIGTAACETVTCGAYNQDGDLVPLVKVGGMEHALKIDIGQHFENYKGRVVELNCFKVFKSGSLRHPSLLRFRDDKMPKECCIRDIMELVD